MWSPPMVSVCAGFHECSWNADGQVRISSTTISGSKRTRSPSTRRPGGGEPLARPGVEEVHPDLGEDAQRRVVDRLQLVRRDDLGRPEAHPRLAERALLGQADR